MGFLSKLPWMALHLRKSTRFWPLWRNVQLDQMMAHHDVCWIVICVFVFLSASPELKATTFVIKGLTVIAKKGNKEIPWPEPREMKVLLTRTKRSV